MTPGGRIGYESTGDGRPVHRGLVGSPTTDSLGRGGPGTPTCGRSLDETPRAGAPAYCACHSALQSGPITAQLGTLLGSRARVWILVSKLDPRPCVHSQTPWEVQGFGADAHPTGRHRQTDGTPAAGTFSRIAPQPPPVTSQDTEAGQSPLAPNWSHPAQGSQTPPLPFPNDQQTFDVRLARAASPATGRTDNGPEPSQARLGRLQHPRLGHQPPTPRWRMGRSPPIHQRRGTHP